MQKFKNCKIVGCSKYGVAADGTVINLQTQKIKKQTKGNAGYLFVGLVDDHGKNITFQVGRLVLMVWDPKAEMFYLDCDHIDGNKANNNVENLRWLTHKENIQAINKREKRFENPHRKGWYLVSYVPGEEEDADVKYYKKLNDAEIPFETVRHRLRDGKYSRKYKAKFYYEEDVPLEFKLKYLKMIALW